MRSSLALLSLIFTSLLAACAPYGSTVQFYDSGNHTLVKSDRPPPHIYSIRDPQFERDLVGHLGSPVLAGNSVQTLVNGDQIFPAMIEAIRGARSTINFETFVYWQGDIGAQFAQALAERAQAGVKVHILLDYFGTQRMDRDLLDLLAKAGAVIEKYHPLRWFTTSGLDHRTHRKLLVIDGRVGFTGGVGIASEWTGNAQDPDHWRDTHYRIEGPAVGQMQAAFISNWVAAEGDQQIGDTYFPALPPRGDLRAQMIHSDGDAGGRVMEVMYLLAIASAKSQVDIATGYFVPTPAAINAMVAARARGVRVRILMPGKYTDASSVRAASRATWRPMLEAGVEMHEYAPTMMHAKLLVVDGYFSSIGSSNFDTRSFRINDEANLNVFDEAFAAAQTRMFERDLTASRRISLEQWEHRPLWERVQERFSLLFKDEL